MSVVPRTATTIVRVVSMTLVALALAGFAATSTAVAPAGASASAGLTIKWTGDDSSASAFQPPRSNSSAHFSEFKNLSVSVSQTTGLIDQAIRVSVNGFAGTKSSLQSGAYATNAKNYMQAMQCWGDPKSSTFNETCQWGGRAFNSANGLGDTVISDNAMRVGPLDIDPSHPTTHDVPFRTVDGEVISGKPTRVNGITQYDLQQYFSPTTTNEVTSARVGADGKGYFDFETQSATQAPQLGCGTSAQLRCWLVIVPRGTVFGGDGEECSGIRDPQNDYELYTKGRPNSVQGGSPVNDKCDYWKNRIVVPLDFAPTNVSCPVGSAEVRVIGSQLMVGAMTSWQPSLCQTVKSTFSFSTNPDSVARAQLLETTPNSPNVAYTGFPVSSGELQTEDERTVLSSTTLGYAPVAISSVVIGFIAEFDGGRQESLNISPRILAKMLTQSYKFTVPSNSSDPTRNFAHLGAVNRKYNYLNQDPDFRALNPDNFNQFTSNPAILLPGPSGADAIRQVWRWILADKDAVDFLNGKPDEAGMTVNPYYLPKGDVGAHVPWYLGDVKQDLGANPVDRLVGLQNIDGTPQKLSESTLDNFPKNDESLVPLQMTLEKTRFDTIQFAPYTENLLSGARQAFRANPNSKTVWDGTKLNAAGESGDWVSSGTQLPGSKFMIAITDSPSATRYGLSTAGLEVANSKEIVLPTTDTVTRALSALQVTSTDTVKQVNPALVPADGYPMTMVTYAAVNMSKAPSAARTIISSMLKEVTTAGQVSGSATGQLPAGYVPLTKELADQATSVAAAITAFVSPPTGEEASGGYAQEGFTGGGAIGGNGVATGTPGIDPAAVDPVVSAGADPVVEARTLASSSAPIAPNILLIALILGILGFIVAPFLFRGRSVF